ncbi:MAG: metal ABC transporter permease [Candidatus Dormibacteraeota bacterium]|nr:metal ABC transporter permease [Candidatus Dormibacteraeota bacterium]
MLAQAAFSWNPVTDWQALTSQEFMRNALLAGTVAAVLCSVVGTFVVLRGLTFAADALTHVGFAGASGAVLFGFPPVAGLLTLTLVVAAAIGALEERLRGRDVVIGMILVGALGLGVLLLRLSAGYSNETYALLFGDILALSARDLVILGAAAGVALTATIAVFRPLLFATIDEEVAESRGIPVRALSIGFMLIVGVAATAATQVVGALLAVALIVAPAAAAQRLTDRPGAAVALAIVLGLAVTWAGLVLGYWLPYPVSFFITSLAAVVYALCRVISSRSVTARRRDVVEAAAAA